MQQLQNAISGTQDALVVAGIGESGRLTMASRADIDCLRMTGAHPDLPYLSENDGCPDH